MHFPGAGKNVLSYKYITGTSLVSCFVHRVVRNRPSVPPKVGFEGIEKVFAAVGLGGAAQPPLACRGMFSQDLYESPNGTQSRRSSAVHERGNGQEDIAQRLSSVTRKHHLKISRICSLASAYESAVSKSRSYSHVLLYRKRA